MSSLVHPLLSEVREVARRLQGRVLQTPVWRWQTGIVEQLFGADTEVWLKLELLQRTGSFKLRGALNCLAAMDSAALARGVVAASAGNHALTVAHAARLCGTQATLVIPRHASPARIAGCRAEGGTVLLVDSLPQAFAEAQRLVAEEGRTLIHPFDGPLTAQGTATLGLEFMQQVPGLQAVVVPVGGGGLCGGVAAAVKQLDPSCAVYGVEPFGADAMYRSFQAGRPAPLPATDTIADSLAVAQPLPYSVDLCRRFVDEIVRVDDDALRDAMGHLYRDVKLATEPASAASTAALLGPLAGRLRGRRVGLVVCGSNLDVPRFAELVGAARTGRMLEEAIQ